MFVLARTKVRLMIVTKREYYSSKKNLIRRIISDYYINKWREEMGRLLINSISIAAMLFVSNLSLAKDSLYKNNTITDALVPCETLKQMGMKLEGGQLCNENPDPKGTPWVIGGLRELTPDEEKELSQFPNPLKADLPATASESDYKMQMSGVAATLPTSADNSTSIYFPRVFSQGMCGSCAQASGIA